MAKSNGLLSPDILARIDNLSLRGKRVVEGFISGHHRSPHHGLSVEFADYREYAPGDDLKRLDWRVYARTDRHYIKQYEQESNLRCHLVVDASASMRYGRGAMNKFQYACTLAASLAHLLIRQRDAVALALCDHARRAYLPASAKPTQLIKLTQILEDARCESDTDLGRVLMPLAEQVRHRGMVVIISDLLTEPESLFQALKRLRYDGHDILVFHILDRDELELPFDGSIMFKDIEGEDRQLAEPRFFRLAYQKAMRDFGDDMRQRVLSLESDYLQLLTDDDLGLALSRFLHHRQLGRGMRLSHEPSHTQHPPAGRAKP